MKRTIEITAIALGTVAALIIAGCAPAMAASEQPETADKTAFATVRDIAIPIEPDGAIRLVGEIVDSQEQQEHLDEFDGDYANGDWGQSGYYGGNDYGNPFKYEGVAYDENYEYTWYSQNVLGGSGLDALNANGRHVDEDTGFIVDGDGYIAVAMNGVEQGTVIDTKWGAAKVYDTKQDGAPYDSTVDIYTDF